MPETTNNAPAPDSHVQPLMNRRLVKRGIIGAVAIITILVVIFIVQSVRDVDLPAHADTVGYIAAIQQMPNGSQVVLIQPDGTVIPSKGYHDGENDRDPVWRPDGNRLFFTSDRDPQQGAAGRQVNLYRWNPASNKIERRTATQGSYQNLLYSLSDSKGHGLVALGGNIVEFDPITGDTAPVLPPAAKNDASTGGEEGRKSTIENSFFNQYGTSFKAAEWFADQKYIVAIMKGDEGETLLLQDMTPVQGQLKPPIALGSGDHVDMDLNRKDGRIIFALQGFKITERDIKNIPPEYIKNGKVTPPYRHMVGLLDPKSIAAGPAGIMAPVVQTPNDQNVFGAPIFSPDGSTVVVTYGVYKESEMQMKGLVSMPARAGGGEAPSFIHKGAVTGMSFSGNGSQIAYSQRERDGRETVHVMSSDGQNDKVAAAGNFTQPRFSPQTSP